MSNSRIEKGKRKYRITAFYMEMLILAAVFVGVILVLARVFALSGEMSIRAKVLTRAVHLAENAAEAVAASDGPETLLLLLGEDGVSWEDHGVTTVRFCYDGDMNPAAEGSFWVDVTRAPDESGSLTDGTVTVYWKGEEVYTLSTAVYAEQ